MYIFIYKYIHIHNNDIKQNFTSKKGFIYQ